MSSLNRSPGSYLYSLTSGTESITVLSLKSPANAQVIQTLDLSSAAKGLTIGRFPYARHCSRPYFSFLSQRRQEHVRDGDILEGILNSKIYS